MPRLSPFVLSLLLVATDAQFAGRTVQCCVLIEHPYVRADPLAPDNQQFSGLAIDYLTLLKARTDFECGKLVEYNGDFVNRTITLAEIPKYSSYLKEEEDREAVECQDFSAECNVTVAREKYRGFTGYTKYMADCTDSDDIDCACELGVSGFSRNFDREDRVDFVAPFAYDSLVVVQRSEDVAIKRSDWFFLEPFSLGVWLSILSVVLLHLFVSLFDLDLPIASVQLEGNGGVVGEQNCCPTLGFMSRVREAIKKAQLVARFRHTFFGTLEAMLDHVSVGQGNADRETPTTRQRFLSLLAVLIGLFLVLSYEASLVNNLFSQKPESEYTDDLFYDCNFNISRVTMPGSGNTENGFWKGVVTKKRKDKLCTDNTPYDTIDDAAPNVDKMFLGLQKLAAGKDRKIDFFLGPRGSTTVFQQGKFCGKLTRVRDFFNFTVTFLLPKNSDMTQALSIKTLELNRQNKIPSAIGYGTSLPCQNKKERKLTWDQMKVFFYVSWAVLVLLALIMIGFRVVKGTKAKSRQAESSSVDTSQTTL